MSPTPGFEVPLDKEAHALWQRYRYHRDVLGESPAATLAKQLQQEDGMVPTLYTDQALQRAVEHLQKQMADRT